MAFERNEHMNGFEEFLKESTDEFQMNPSDSVWNAVHNDLHTTPRWPYYTLTIIFISLGIIANLRQTPHNQSISRVNSKAFQNEISIKRNDLSSAKKINSPTTKNTELITEPVRKEQNQISGQIKLRNISSKYFASGNNISKKFDEKNYNIERNIQQPIHHISYNLSKVEQTKREYFFNEKVTIQQPIISSLIPLTSSLRTISESNKISKEKISKQISQSVISRKFRKAAWSLYFSPAVSYRKLRGTAQAFNNYSFIRTDVNSAVMHLPMLGMEMGSAIIFNPQDKIRFKIGIQFNLNQYDIKAYNAVPEVTSLNVSGIGQAPIKTIAYHRNFDGFKETWLKNKHIMLSIPMSSEIRVMGDQKLSLNIAAGIQPTYMLSENPYLISSNLKNYAKAPSGLLRNFNINGSMESFVSFKSGNLRWTMGPQFRYQLLSNFKRTYQFTEHLTDFGFKVGVIKNFK